MDPVNDLNTVVFPLRTSVELFTGVDQPSAVARAKQAAVLYERVIFEEGLLDVSITTTGPPRSWTPREQVTQEDLARSRQPIPAGTRVTFAFGKQPRRGAAARTEDMVAIESSMLVRYMAEFHSGILDELEPFDADWLETFVLPDYAGPRDTACDRSARLPVARRPHVHGRRRRTCARLRL